jgi:hypothetical protein
MALSNREQPTLFRMYFVDYVYLNCSLRFSAGMLLDPVQYSEHVVIKLLQCPSACPRGRSRPPRLRGDLSLPLFFGTVKGTLPKYV